MESVGKCKDIGELIANYQRIREKGEINTTSFITKEDVYSFINYFELLFTAFNNSRELRFQNGIINIDGILRNLILTYSRGERFSTNQVELLENLYYISNGYRLSYHKFNFGSDYFQCSKEFKEYPSTKGEKAILNEKCKKKQVQTASATENIDFFTSPPSLQLSRFNNTSRTEDHSERKIEFVDLDSFGENEKNE
ncbi:MAG TPA: hypothetical protein ENI29_20865, partial [bacterium]|nr:hypothetical protein [bacterium]